MDGDTRVDETNDVVDGATIDTRVDETKDVVDVAIICSLEGGPSGVALGPSPVASLGNPGPKSSEDVLLACRALL